MIGIVNYGLGNVQAFLNVYKKLNISAIPVNAVDDFGRVNGVILPGVGAFDEAMERLENSGLLNALNSFACVQKKPVLGVCVGMQIMAQQSDEGTKHGLSWIPAQIRKFNSRDQRLPHMGWNTIESYEGQKLFDNIVYPQFYFLHSYYFVEEDSSHVIARSHYSVNFASAVQKNNVFGTQFHPEKSHEWGTLLLQNFANICQV